MAPNLVARLRRVAEFGIPFDDPFPGLVDTTRRRTKSEFAASLLRWSVCSSIPCGKQGFAANNLQVFERLSLSLCREQASRSHFVLSACCGAAPRAEAAGSSHREQAAAINGATEQYVVSAAPDAQTASCDVLQR